MIPARTWLAIVLRQRAVAALVLGTLAGWLLGPAAGAWLGPLGALYLTLLQMAIVPLVFFAVIDAVPLLHGRLAEMQSGARTFAWFACTAVLAVGAGLLVGAVLQPGGSAALPADAGSSAPHATLGPVQALLDLVPANPFAALADGRLLQIVCFAGLFGAALAKLGERTQSLRLGVGQAGEAMGQVTRFVLALMPLGIFGLVAVRVGTHGVGGLLPMAYFALALYVACALHMVAVYGGLLLAHGLDPLKFFRGAAPALRVSFVRSSSAAALPLSLQAAIDRLGVDRGYATQAVPLGTVVKMDGCAAIYPALAVLFAAQLYGIELGFAQYTAILLAAVLGGFGTAGVPATSTVMVVLVLSAAGLPLEVLGLLLAIDRILDPMRTMTNVAGQVLVPVLVARERGYTGPRADTG